MAKVSMKAIKQEVLRQIKPQDQSIKKEALGMVAAVNREIEKGRINAVAVPGGSVAKDTYLKDDFDVDIFVKFDVAYQDKDLSRLLARILRPFKTVRVHGSRDYFQIKDRLHYEMVPVLDIREASQAVNVTDMSPMHVRWVKDRIRKRPELADEIRLAKQFCKAAKCYGAESFIGGFSGHVLDILLLHFGSFERFLKGMVGMRKGTLIDPKNHHKGKARRHLNQAKLQSPLIVIDPILPDRNAAAALTDERFLRLKAHARKYLKAPSSTFFRIKSITAADLLGEDRKETLLLLEAKPKKGKTDIIGSKLLKTFEHLRRQLEAHDFKVLEADWQWDKSGKALFWYLVPKRRLTAEKTWPGPIVRQKRHAAQFRQKHKKIVERKGRLYARVRRKHVLAKDLLDRLLTTPYVAQRVASIRQVS